MGFVLRGLYVHHNYAAMRVPTSTVAMCSGNVVGCVAWGILHTRSLDRSLPRDEKFSSVRMKKKFARETRLM